MKCKECGKDLKSLNELELHVTYGHVQSNTRSILSSTQNYHDDIEKLLKECKKDLLDDDGDDEVNDKIEVVDEVNNKRNILEFSIVYIHP